jgi:hypothetical protein
MAELVVTDISMSPRATAFRFVAGRIELAGLEQLADELAARVRFLQIFSRKVRRVMLRTWFGPVSTEMRNLVSA